MASLDPSRDFFSLDSARGVGLQGLDVLNFFLCEPDVSHLEAGDVEPVFEVPAKVLTKVNVRCLKKRVSGRVCRCFS